MPIRFHRGYKACANDLVNLKYFREADWNAREHVNKVHQELLLNPHFLWLMENFQFGKNSLNKASAIYPQSFRVFFFLVLFLKRIE